ncbi:hypothetical protein CRUP_031017, partial [Coryphaenoides rupestris]
MIDRRFGQPVYPSTPSTNHVTLLPESFLVSRSLQPISRRDFLSVLADVTSVSACGAGFRRVDGVLYGGVCEACRCHGHSAHCHQTTGDCLPNCWWDPERQECLPCQCSPQGALAQRCDVEGRCICRPGHSGRRCDLRRQGGYERRETRRPVERVPVPEVGQQRWDGSARSGGGGGSSQRSSGPSRTGGCPRGAYRPKIAPQTYGIARGGACVPCHCNSFGSKSFDCDEAGQCRCQPGVGGPKCDRCSRSFFLFQEGGCTPCDCSEVGNNCDANTGQCICPPNTIGERCDRCAPNHWGHDIMTGCKECGCSVVGSVAQQCNMNTGCCQCRDAYRGEKCNECQLGYRDFPQCTACECNASGSESETCDPERGVCACADRTGKCSCKLALKPDQTSLPLVDKSNSVETRTGVSFQHPEILAHAELVTAALTEPYYWRLPEQFRGSMITAYGGQLKYAVYYEARDETGPASYEPQVVIRGGPSKDKTMMRHTPGLQIGQLTRHEIYMTELLRLSPPAPPNIHPTTFSPTCVSEGFDDYRCTDCPEGYEGRHCESTYTSPEQRVFSGIKAKRCASGYHGNPQMPGGRCEECKCTAWGALPGPCDPVSGQCRCRGGASGLASCDDDCAGLLISDMDNLYGVITAVNLTTPLPPPYKILYRFENMTEELKHMLSPQRAPERLLQLADSNLGSVVTEMDQLHNRATKVSADGEQVEDDAGRIHKGAEDLLRFIQDTLLGATELQAKAAELNATLSRRAGAPEKSLKEMKAEIQTMLAELRARQLAGMKDTAVEELGDGDLADHVADAERHALQLNESAAILDGILAEAKNLSFNATAAFKAPLKNYSELEDTVRAANHMIQDPEKNTDRLLEKLQPIKKLQDNLRRNISQIKELISQARKQANSIKVSVSSGGDCLRSYRPDIWKGRYNTIVLHVKTTTADNLLFYLGSAKY